MWLGLSWKQQPDWNWGGAWVEGPEALSNPTWPDEKTNLILHQNLHNQSKLATCFAGPVLSWLLSSSQNLFISLIPTFLLYTSSIPSIFFFFSFSFSYHCLQQHTHRCSRQQKEEGGSHEGHFRVLFSILVRPDWFWGLFGFPSLFSFHPIDCMVFRGFFLYCSCFKIHRDFLFLSFNLCVFFLDCDFFLFHENSHISGSSSVDSLKKCYPHGYNSRALKLGLRGPLWMIQRKLGSSGWIWFVLWEYDGLVGFGFSLWVMIPRYSNTP